MLEEAIEDLAVTSGSTVIWLQAAAGNDRTRRRENSTHALSLASNEEDPALSDTLTQVSSTPALAGCTYNTAATIRRGFTADTVVKVLKAHAQSDWAIQVILRKTGPNPRRLDRRDNTPGVSGGLHQLHRRVFTATANQNTSIGGGGAFGGEWGIQRPLVATAKEVDFSRRPLAFRRNILWPPHGRPPLLPGFPERHTGRRRLLSCFGDPL